MSAAELPPRFKDLKAQIAASIPKFEERVSAAWVDLLDELAKTTDVIAKAGSDYIPRVKYSELSTLSPERVAEIKKKGSLVIQDVVDDDVAAGWKRSLEEFIGANPDVEGYPENDKQFFQLYWTKPQLEARSHPNVLGAGMWLNNLYDIQDKESILGVDLSTPLSYADRFRIRHPGREQWTAHPPHVDGGGIERWEDEGFRACFADILNGNWREHNPYELAHRINAKSSIYGRKNQASILRTFQGWLAMSQTGPQNGTLQVFPDVKLSNAYNILRPFFSLKPGIRPESDEALLGSSWQFDISTSAFPGIFAGDGGFYGPRPTTESHPHLKLESTMISMPKVAPGDMVFWHCDVIHAVEKDHVGSEDSAVMYIPAVPLTPQNAEYVFGAQLESFKRRETPGDFSGKNGQPKTEAHFNGIGTPEMITSDLGRHAMGLVSA